MAAQQVTGRSLDTLCGAPMETGRFLQLAIRITAALAKLHQKNIIHKNIEPRNILVDPETSAVMLTGLSTTSLFPQEYPTGTSRRNIEITPAYMSPEQTGRMNRLVDYRTDLYSLGITFYEMLTGTLPFQADNIMEWVHCHIARTPRLLTKVVPEIPPTLSDIVMKLLAKNAEDRYQTASGLQFDLEKCFEQWKAGKEIERFPLGKWDIPDRLLIPQKLYGREREIDALMAAFVRVVESGKPEVVMVAGYSGIGKTSLVRELYQPVLREHGYFISGKFDQYKRDIPYSTIAEAFRDVIGQILTESEERIFEWKRQLLQALGNNGQLIIDIIPQLELIIGRQPPVPQLPPTEAQNRFNMFFRQFVNVFAKKEHPLVVFLDDLQWVDSATLKLLQYIIRQSDTRYLLFIGAFRNNEVTASHPLTLALNDILKTGAILQTITLLPLSRENLGQFIADIFCSGQPRCEPLANLIYEKTGGNPFFVIQFVKTLYGEGLMEFDAMERLWKWDIAGIENKGYTDNVVDLMVGKLKKLSDRSLQEMRLAACIGSRFDLHTLAVISNIPDEKLLELLREALEEGLVLPLSETTCKFLHDRVQEAAYSLVPEADRAGLHLRIGRLLLAHTSGEIRDEEIFDVVNHFNRGVDLVADPGEKESLRRLNVHAARKARGSAAYASARNYMQLAATLLPPDAWTTGFEEAFTLHLDLAECEFIVGDFRRADELLDALLGKAVADLDRGRIYLLRMQLYQGSGRFEDAWRTGLGALRLFGFAFPDTGQGIDAAFKTETRQIRENLAGCNAAELVDAPAMVAPDELMIMRLLIESWVPAYNARPEVHPLLIARTANFSLRHGNAPESSLAYAGYAMLLVASFGDMQAAFEFAEAALPLAEKFGDARTRAAVISGYGMLSQWWRPIATCIPSMDRGFSAQQELGDLARAGIMAIIAAWSVIVEKGDPLDEVLKASDNYLTFAEESRNDTVRDTLRLIRQLVPALKGATREPGSFDDDTFSETAYLAEMAKASYGAGIALHRILKQITAFLYGRYNEALEVAVREEAAPSPVAAFLYDATHHFFRALTAAALHRRAPPRQQQEFSRILDEELKRHKLWAESCPENFLNRYALVSAEIARIEGRELEAERLYEEAIRTAHENGFVQNEALANELAAKFYLDRGFERIAHAYLREARSCYARWGADGKVRQLDEKHPLLAAEEKRGVVEEAGAIGRVDAIAVVKGSQAISGEIIISNLLDTLMKIVIENGGAQKAYLIVARGDDLSIEAHGWVEGEEIKVLQEATPPLSAVLPVSMVNYVRRTRQSVILNDASSELTMFSSDEYIIRNKPVSVLCLPVLRQAKLIGLLYLENNIVKGAFTPDRIAVLEVLAAQAAISLENSRLYAALRESQHLLQSIIDNSTTVVYVKDLEGRYLMINRRYEELFHVTREAVPGKTDYDLFPRVRADAYRAFDRRVLAAGTAMEAEEVVPQDDGLHTYISIKAPLYDEAGKPYAVCGISADITERKRAEEALKKAHEELEQRVIERTKELSEANMKLQEMDRLKSMFIASMSHELRTPLNSVIGFSSILLNEWVGPLNPEQKDNLAAILRSGKHLLALVNDVIDVSKIEAGMIEPEIVEFDVAEVLTEVAATFAKEIHDKGLALQVESVRQTLRADRRRLLQCVLNLVSNAVKFTERGSVRISARAVNGGVEITVADTGIGISEEDLPRLFSPFVRLESPLRLKVTGTGLGLYLTKKLVSEVLRGQVDVTSRSGEGSTFSIRVPGAKENGK